MHSTLQSELRLTHRSVKRFCQHCTRCCDPPKRSFHQGRFLRSSQGAPNDANSQPRPLPSNEDQREPQDPSIAPAPPYTRHTFPSLPNLVASQGGQPPEEPNFSQIPGFHGSLWNRRMRASAVKELPKPQTVIPDWFTEANVNLLGEGDLGPEAKPSTKIHTDLINGQNIAVGGTGRPDDPPGSNPDIVADSCRPKELDAVRADTPLRTQRRRTGHYDPQSFIEYAQAIETKMTASGLIIPSRKPDFDGEPANKTSHLCLQYAVPYGDLLLDDYVHSLAAEVGCDLMTLDVQDIAEMIATSHQPSDVVSEARHMSYDVLQSINSTAESVDDSPFFDEFDEDMDDEGDSFENSPMNGSSRLPIVMGKPITIDLTKFFGGRPNSNATEPKSLRDRLLGPLSEGLDKMRAPASPFTDLVDRLLAVIQEKRYKATATEGSGNSAFTGPDFAPPQTMIHIKDLKAVQDNSVGGQFLTELYAQVRKRRSNGERIIIIGTECSHRGDAVPSAKQIEEMQKVKNHEISRTIFLTPPLNLPATINLESDRKQRTAMVNMRHLYEMMSVRQIDAQWFDLAPGFWKTDTWLGKSKQYWASTDLGKKVLGFSDVHRIATMLAGLSSGPHESTSKLTGKERNIALEVVETMMRDSDESKTKWVKSQPGSNKSESKHITAEDTQIAKVRSSATKHEKKLLSGVIEPSNITTTFNDVHAPIETIDALQTLTTLSLIRPEAFSYGVLASDKIPGLLLYGPPGTGKTLLAKAVAKESGARVLEVSAADINDMYVGEGEKNVKALFSLAKKLSPCVVFLDEADAMFSARANSGRRVSHRELLNQFLKEWDGMSNDSGSAFIMVATNRPMDLDDAVLRRLPRRLLVDLPTEQDRHAILKIHLKNEQLAEDVKLEDLARRTPFYSGSDLKNVAVAAALNAVKEENAAAKQHAVRQAETQVEGGETAAEEYKFPEKRTLTASHFEKALEDITASISEDMSSLKDIKKFDEQYGDKKGKKKRPTWGFKSAGEADKVLETVKVRNA